MSFRTLMWLGRSRHGVRAREPGARLGIQSDAERESRDAAGRSRFSSANPAKQRA